jgi:hypothetical protein
MSGAGARSLVLLGVPALSACALVLGLDDHYLASAPNGTGEGGSISDGAVVDARPDGQLVIIDSGPDAAIIDAGADVAQPSSTSCNATDPSICTCAPGAPCSIRCPSGLGQGCQAYCPPGFPCVVTCAPHTPIEGIDCMSGTCTSDGCQCTTNGGECQ